MKIIVTDCDHVNMDQEDAVFGAAGMTYELHQCKTEEELMTECRGGAVFLNQYAPFTRRVLETLRPDIKLIVRYGVGVDNVDCQAAAELGVQVCNVPDYGMNEVADQAVGMLLALARKVCAMNRLTKSGRWDYADSIPLHRLAEQTVGIVGVGRIGSAFARRMTGFGCRIIAADPRFRVGERVEGAEIVSFDRLIKESDLISIHCPLTETTKNMFGTEVFRAMKNGAYLVNTARGGIVSESDLYNALKEGELAGAALDVVEREPMPSNSRLFELENFLCTPHMAWYSVESAMEMKRKAAEEARRFIEGGQLLYPVNTPLKNNDE